MSKIKRLKKDSPLMTYTVTIKGKPYLVEDKPTDEVIRKRGPSAFRKGVAYRVNTSLIKLLMPYRGVLNSPDEFSRNLEPGIYFVRRHSDQYFMRYVLPHGKKEQSYYKLGLEQNTAIAVVDRTISPEQFADVRITAADVGGESFQPPLFQEDDALNSIIKTGIRLKDAPYEPYGKRMAALAADKFNGIEGSNIKNNLRRAFRVNTTMSATKAYQIADTYQMELCYLLKDQPGAMHPMFPDKPDTILAVFPNGIPFEIDPVNIVDATDIIQTGIQDTKLLNQSSNQTGGEDDEPDDSEF